MRKDSSKLKSQGDMPAAGSSTISQDDIFGTNQTTSDEEIHQHRSSPFESVPEYGESPHKVSKQPSKVIHHALVHTPGYTSNSVTEGIQQKQTCEYDRLFTPMDGPVHGRRRSYPSTSISADFSGSIGAGFCSDLSAVEQQKFEELQAIVSHFSGLPPPN